MRFQSSSSEEGENILENPMVERESVSVDVSENRINMRFKCPSSEEGEKGLENLTAKKESLSVVVPLDIVKVKKSKKIGGKNIPVKLKELLETGLL
ncbi:hypothetical protein LguiA_021249 [Lonicera macranthoides]